MCACNIREGNGTPLQYSCLENPMDGGAWWAAVTGSRRVGQDWATEQQQQQTGNMVVPFFPHSAVISILIMMHSSGCFN